MLCKGEDAYPATLPRPVVTPLPLTMPLACAEPAEPTHERERLLSALMLNEYRSAAVDEGTDEQTSVQDQLLRGFTKLDSATLKLINTACKHERNARALDLVTQLQLPKSLTGALKLANHYKLGPLAERIARLMEARFEEGASDADVEEAPPQPTVRLAAARSSTAMLPASKGAAAAPEPAAPRAEQADDEDNQADETNEPSADLPATARAPLNPFSKTNKAVSDITIETSKGPKRTLPVTSAVGIKKSRK